MKSKYRIIFLKTHLLLIFVKKKFFFQKYIEIELKIFITISEEFFE